MAYIYREGLGNVPHDYALALKWYRKLAAEGNPDAEVALGHMCEEGMGVPASVNDAIEWYQRAAKHNQVDARSALHRLGVSPEK